MIYIKDNFLPLELYNKLTDYCDEFKEVITPGKSFFVKELPIELINYIERSLEKLEGRNIKSILCFAREAKQGQDNSWRIHNDTIIEGQQPDRAMVFIC